MEEPTVIVIKRRSQTEEVKVPLKMTQKEFDKITSQYSTGHKTVKKYTRFSLETAEKAAKKGEEVKMENVNSVDVDGFEKAVCLLKYWAEITLNAMMQHKNFRIEINYNAEAVKTDFCIYTPIEDGKDDTKREH